MAVIEIIESDDKFFYNTLYKVDKEMLIFLKNLAYSRYFKATVEELDKLLSEDKDFYVIGVRLFDEIFSVIADKVESIIDNPPIINPDTPLELIEQAKVIEDVTKSIRDITDFNNKDYHIKQLFHGFISTSSGVVERQDRLKDFLDASKKLIDYHNEYYLLRDLISACKDISKNLSYFMDDESVTKYQNRFNDLVKSRNIKGAKEFLEEVQQLILNHWGEYVSNIDNYKFGDEFRLICHSSKNPYLRGNFETKYISTSLLTNDLTDTYNSPYGFIFAPKNIQGASPKDMYVNNAASNEDDLLHYSSIKIIHSPERLVEECLLLKKENEKENNNNKVYNEVIIDGFEPIAIFCITDGTKELCEEYRCAKRLQSQFPHLKIIELDGKRRLKTDDDVIRHKVWMLSKLYHEELQSDFLYKSAFFKGDSRSKSYANFGFGASEYSDEQVLSMYRIFFRELDKFKTDGNINYEQILQSFKYNYNLVENLSVFNDGYLDQCSEEEFEIIARFNRYSSVKEMPTRYDNATCDFIRVSTVLEQFGKYANDPRINAIPALCEFFNLLSGISNDDIYKFSYINAKSIEELNDNIKEEVLRQEAIRQQEEAIRIEQEKEIFELENAKNGFISDKEGTNSRILELLSQKKSYEQQLEVYAKNKEIVDMEFYYSLAQSCIKSSEEQKENSQTRLKRITDEESSKNAELLNLDQSIQKYLKYKLLYRKKVALLLLDKQTLLSTVSHLQNDKQTIKDDISYYEGEITAEEKDFFEKTGIEYLNFESSLQSAKQVIQDIDYDGLTKQLSIINEQLLHLKMKLESIEGEIFNIECSIDRLNMGFEPTITHINSLDDTFDFGVSSIYDEEKQDTYSSNGETR